MIQVNAAYSMMDIVANQILVLLWKHPETLSGSAGLACVPRKEGRTVDGNSQCKLRGRLWARS